MVPQTQIELREQLKKRLFASISAQIDQIGYVPEDIVKLVGNFNFDSDSTNQMDDDFAADGESGDDSRSPENRENDHLATHINDFYDHIFYNGEGILGLLHKTSYRNIGYWDETTTTQGEASERLQDILLDFIPEKSGRILDVACGIGGSTRHLFKHYAPENIWAINISPKQIESVKTNAPGCHAQVMNAVDMTFEDDFFENIICIEAAFHFQTRRKFLEQSLRVLKQGGRLVLSDILFTSRARLEQYSLLPGPENYLETIDEFRDLLSDVGFRNIVITDVTEEVWTRHFLHAVNLVHEKFCEGVLNIVQVTDILWSYYHVDAYAEKWLFVSAEK